MTPEDPQEPLKRLSAFQEEFCLQYTFDRNAAAAARRAGASTKSKTSPGVTACRLMKRPEIVARIAELDTERRQRLHIDNDEILRDLLEMSRVDINEIVEMRRVNCRRCHGLGHRHQWGLVEAEEAQARWDSLTEAAKKKGEPPDFSGGIDFNPWGEPNTACPVCGGEGQERAYFHDTRTLSPSARRVYEGVQISRDGTKVMISDKASLQDKVARAVGLYKDRVELTGKDGEAIKIGLGHFYGGDGS